MMLKVKRTDLPPHLIQTTAELYTPQIADILKEIRELKKTLPGE